jgi:flavin-dependent dehydrogenase
VETHPKRTSYDAIVVGARVAGAATALLLARAGLNVLVLERGQYGTDTLSTHALMRGAVLQLARWRLLPALEAAGTPLIRRTTFEYGDQVVCVDIAPRDGVPGLFAPRRHLLDRVLVDAARAAGAEVVFGTSVHELLYGPGGRVRGVRAGAAGERAITLEAQMIVGADGLGSAVARLTAAPVSRQGRWAGAVVYGYWPTEPSDQLHWSWGTGTAAGLIPTNDGHACVFVAVPAPHFAPQFRGDLEGGYWRVLDACAPALADRLRASGLVPRLRGFAGAPGVMRQAIGPGWALVGDAGYFKDPITAHGITDALRDADLLASAILDGRDAALGEYQTARDDLSTTLFDISDEIASFGWSFERLGELHRRLSDEMRREVAALRTTTPDKMTA